MNFKKFFYEMVHMTLPQEGEFILPCDDIVFKIKDMEHKKVLKIKDMECKEALVKMIDFRFEDYLTGPMPMQFIAKIPNSEFYIVYHGFFKEAEILSKEEKDKLKDEKIKYEEIQEDWYIHALFLSEKGEIIKPALSYIDGRRNH